VPFSSGAHGTYSSMQLEDGTIIDSSRQRGQPLLVKVGEGRAIACTRLTPGASLRCIYSSSFQQVGIKRCQCSAADKSLT
jgi:hypothetical protein